MKIGDKVKYKANRREYIIAEVIDILEKNNTNEQIFIGKVLKSNMLHYKNKENKSFHFAYQSNYWSLDTSIDLYTNIIKSLDKLIDKKS